MDLLTFGANLKFLRKEKELTLEQMSASIGFHKNTLQGYEAGNSYPKFQDLLKIAEHFGVPETDLIHRDLSKGNLTENEKTANSRLKGNLKGNGKGNLTPDIYPFSEPPNMLVNEPDTPYGRSKMPAIITVAQAGIDNIIYVPVKAQAGYLHGYEDKEFIEKLPSFQMPGLRNATFRMFEVAGVSMNPGLQDRDKVIGEWVGSFAELRENRVHVMVLKSGVCIKRVLNRVDKRGKLYLKSDTLAHRQEYPIMEIDPSEVIEMWYVRLKVSSDLSEPSEIYNRVSELEINQLKMMEKLGLKS